LGVPRFNKAKPIEIWGRKATGLDVLVGPTVALLATIQSTSRTSGFWEGTRAAAGSFQTAKEGIMAKYIALHTLKKSAEELTKALNTVSAELAKAMAAGAFCSPRGLNSSTLTKKGSAVSENANVPAAFPGWMLNRKEVIEDRKWAVIA